MDVGEIVARVLVSDERHDGQRGAEDSVREPDCQPSVSDIREKDTGPRRTASETLVEEAENCEGIAKVDERCP